MGWHTWWRPSLFSGWVSISSGGMEAMPTLAVRLAALAAVSLSLGACGGVSPAPHLAVGDLTADPRLGSSTLSPIRGAEDDFGPVPTSDLVRAAQTVPLGAAQSSLVENGRTAQEVSVQVVRDENGKQQYRVSVHDRLSVTVPGTKVRKDLRIAVFTDLLPGIEPDISSYPHSVFGLRAGGGEMGAFRDRVSPERPAAFDPVSRTGTAAYVGDAVALLAVAGTMEKFVADVRLIADFDRFTVSGWVDGFRSVSGERIGGLTVTLGETSFTTDGEPFAGETSSSVPGGGRWGARWSRADGSEKGGTFGFAADDGSVAVLGAFEACSCPSKGGGNPGDTDATSP